MKTRTPSRRRLIYAPVLAGAVLFLIGTADLQAQYNYTTLSAPGALSTGAAGISGNNIVGSYHFGTGRGITQSFLYDGNSYSILDVPGQVFGIDGENIVGTITAGVPEGFLYNGNSSSTVNVPGSIYTIAVGISGNNIVGRYYSGYTIQGFLYDGISYTTLSVPGAIATYAYGVDGSNIVGCYFTSGNFAHGFLYDGSGYTTLNVPGANYTYACGISGNNIVGYYYTGNSYQGFLYDGSGYTTLSVPGAVNTTANDIDGNNIVGSFSNENGSYGFLATPIPEPSSLAMLAIGAATLLVGCPRLLPGSKPIRQ